MKFIYQITENRLYSHTIHIEADDLAHADLQIFDMGHSDGMFGNGCFDQTTYDVDEVKLINVVVDPK